MRFDANTFLSKALGDDFLETLSKTELYKPNANVAIDLEDIRIGLKVVPRVVMSLLIRELPQMKNGEAKSVHLMLGKNAVLNVNKHDTDTYSGSIVDDGKMIVNFKFRPLPGVGLVIMSAFELYELEDLEKEPSKHFAPAAELNVQKLIDERLAMHDLVHQVVERKLSEREAIQKLFHSKIQEAITPGKRIGEIVDEVLVNTGNASVEINNQKYTIKESKSDASNLADILRNDPHTYKDEYQRGMHNGIAVLETKPGEEPKFIDPVKKSVKKESPLKSFLAKKEAKKPKQEFQFKMIKGETIECPDCKKNIFDGKLYTGCICLGDDYERKVFIKKTEDSFSISFSKGWDSENIEMLLDVLRKRYAKT